MEDNMNKMTVIKNIDETRDSGLRPHASKLSAEACAAFAETYVSNRGEARDIYSYDQLGKYYGVSNDFASQAVTRAVSEGLIPFATCVKIMRHGAGNQRRKAYFNGEFTSTERRLRKMIVIDRFNAIKSLPEKNPDKYESLFRNFLSPETLSFQRLKSVYGYSASEVLYFVMIAAIRDMPDTSYARFQDIVLSEFIEYPFYMDYVEFIEKARERVKTGRESYLEFYEASKLTKNQQDPDFMKRYEDAKRTHYEEVAKIISSFEDEIEQFRLKVLGW